MAVGVVDLLEVVHIQHQAHQPPLWLQPLPGVAQVAAQVLAVVEAGDQVHGGGLVLDVDVQGHHPHRHGHPDEGDAVEEELEDAADKDGGEEDHHRQEEIPPQLPPGGQHQHGAVNEVAVADDVGQQHQGGAGVDVLRGDGEKDVGEHAGHPQQHHGGGGPHRLPDVALHMVQALKELEIHIDGPDKGEGHVGDEEQGVGHPVEGQGQREGPPVQEKGAGLQQAQRQGQGGHGAEDLFIEEHMAGIEPVADEQHDHQGRPNAVADEDSLKIEHGVPSRGNDLSRWIQPR